MKRRQAIQALLGTPALTALPQRALASPQSPRPPDESVKLTLATGDAVADPVPAFLTAQQLAALDRLGDLLVPAVQNRPGASQAKAAEFLDFLLTQSSHERRVLYRNGLDRLQLESGKRYNRRFEDLTAEQAGAILSPLHEKWSYQGPADSFARFLRAAKDNLIAATFSSREFAEAQRAAGRRASGTGTYWFPIE